MRGLKREISKTKGVKRVPVDQSMVAFSEDTRRHVSNAVKKSLSAAAGAFDGVTNVRKAVKDSLGVDVSMDSHLLESVVGGILTVSVTRAFLERARLSKDEKRTILARVIQRHFPTEGEPRRTSRLVLPNVFPTEGAFGNTQAVKPVKPAVRAASEDPKARPKS